MYLNYNTIPLKVNPVLLECFLFWFFVFSTHYQLFLSWLSWASDVTRLDLSLSTEDKTQGGKTQIQTATEDNAWQETQHLVSIIFRLTRVVSQITVQSAKMAVKCYCNMSIIVVNRGKKPSIIQILEDQTVSPYVTFRKMIFNLSHFQGWTIYAKNSRVLIKVFGELKLQTAFCKNLTIEPLIYVVSGSIIGKTDYYSNQSAYKRIK